MERRDTIVALVSGSGGAISIVRVSGDRAIDIVDSIFKAKSGSLLSNSKGFTLHYGNIYHSNGDILDDAVVSLFRAPRSYSGEDMVEISVHASSYIITTLLSLLVDKGCRGAEPGEFTLRAYTNGKMALSEAEAVADLISSSNASSHRIATNQMRGGYTLEFVQLRDKLLNTISLIELELDFGEEDVEFADRSQLLGLLNDIENKIALLVTSFTKGNAIKRGVPVVIVGSPNAGKSTLLNALLGDDRAIVSDIAGTTRDIIEESKVIGDVTFRFIDTAGLRDTTDTIESIGIGKTYQAMEKAEIVILMLDTTLPDDLLLREIEATELLAHQRRLLLYNKSDIGDCGERLHRISGSNDFICISAKEGRGVSELEEWLLSTYDLSVGDGSSDIIISNVRHYDLLKKCLSSILRARNGIENGISGDFISQDLRESSYYIGSITGEITTDEILGNIFKNFCIGK